MPNETTPQIKSRDAGNTKLVYVLEFRKLLKENPGVVKSAIELADRAVVKYHPPIVTMGKLILKYDEESGEWMQKYDTQPDDFYLPMSYGRGTILCPAEPVKDEEHNLTVQVLGRSNRDMGRRIDKCDYLKMSMGGKDFFVKRSFITISPGVTEFENEMSAKELLKGLDFVEVIEPQLGYQDKKESWYVSEWQDFVGDEYGPMDIPFDDYGNAIQFKGEDEFMGYESEEEFNDVQKKAKQIKERLYERRIHRDLRANLFYSRKRKKFFLIDVTGEDPSKTLGNPLR